jgi:hypothetical protein
MRHRVLDPDAVLGHTVTQGAHLSSCMLAAAGDQSQLPIERRNRPVPPDHITPLTERKRFVYASSQSRPMREKSGAGESEDG